MSLFKVHYNLLSLKKSVVKCHLLLYEVKYLLTYEL